MPTGAQLELQKAEQNKETGGEARPLPRAVGCTLEDGPHLKPFPNTITEERIMFLITALPKGKGPG